ncbi:MAG: flagellar basal-body MS-ring/collar protein FliF [Candidatus Binatia bacterium]
MNPSQLLAHAARLRANLSTTQLVSLVGAFIAVVAVVVGSAYWANAPAYTVLYRDLDPESANAVITKLKASNTPYQLEGGGTMLLVPATRIDELRLDFAAQGLPTAGRIGFELLDKTTFGTTEFMEGVNYRRALEGELARTIATIDDVASARVHLAMATERLYASDSQPAKASVVLKLRTSRPLSPQTVAGITGLVASAVESLRPESVVIVDTFGRPLSKPPEDETTAAGPGLEHQQTYEHELMTKVVSLLEPVVGPGHVRVNVAARFTAGSSEETEESWDPNSVVRSQQKSSDTTSNASSSSRTGKTGGIAGARSNAPPDASTANAQTLQVAGAEGTAGRVSETTNYEIGKKTRHTVAPSGQVERLSVAVIVDDERTPAAEGKPAASKPRDPAVMDRIKGLVATSVGLDTDRGDQLTVENIAFEDTTAAPEEPAGPWWKQMPTQMKTTLGVSVSDVMRWALVTFLALVALFAVIRPMVRGALAPAAPALLPAAPGDAGVPALAGGTPAGVRTVAELEQDIQAAASKREAGRAPALTRSIAAKVDSEPEHVAHVVRAMIAQEER